MNDAADPATAGSASSSAPGASLARVVSPRAVLEAFGPDVPVYAILDGARDPRIHRWVLETHSIVRCLYRGELTEELAAAAPYLLRLGRGHGFTEEFFAIGWNNSWGVLFASETPSRELHRHLRRFLQVRTEEGKRLVFRYYDPRVLRGFLPTCTKEELEMFFGPIDAFACEADDRSKFHFFRRSEKGLEQKLLSSITPAAPGSTAPPTSASATTGADKPRAEDFAAEPAQSSRNPTTPVERS